MTDQKPTVVYAATYDSVSAAEADLDAIEKLHKGQVIGAFDAAVIDKKEGEPHIAKRMDRPSVRVIPEWFGGGTCLARNSSRWPRNSPPARQG